MEQQAATVVMAQVFLCQAAMIRIHLAHHFSTSSGDCFSAATIRAAHAIYREATRVQTSHTDSTARATNLGLCTSPYGGHSHSGTAQHMHSGVSTVLAADAVPSCETRGLSSPGAQIITQSPGLTMPYECQTDHPWQLHCSAASTGR